MSDVGENASVYLGYINTEKYINDAIHYLKIIKLT
jgi:hypothetical protein